MRGGGGGGGGGWADATNFFYIKKVQCRVYSSFLMFWKFQYSLFLKSFLIMMS